MNLPQFPSRRTRKRHAAFTLIELLVVISIIAVLAGLLLPVVGKVTENAKKVSCKSTEAQIVSAINNFQTDYGQYPVAPPAGGTLTADTVYGADGHNNTLFNVLRATESNGAAGATATVMNTRSIVYFEGKNVKNETLPRDGFTLTATGKSAFSKKTFNVGDLVDPWGNAYFACIDTNYNSVVTNPYKDPLGTGDDATVTTGAVLRLGAVVYSYGLDGQPGDKGVAPSAPTYSGIGDDVISWQ